MIFFDYKRLIFRLKTSLVGIIIILVIYFLDSVGLFKKIEKFKQMNYMQENVFGTYQCIKNDTTNGILKSRNFSEMLFLKIYIITLDKNYKFNLSIFPMIEQNGIKKIDSTKISYGAGNFSIEDLTVRAKGKYLNITSYNNMDSLFNNNYYYLGNDNSLNNYFNDLEFKKQ